MNLGRYAYFFLASLAVSWNKQQSVVWKLKVSVHEAKVSLGSVSY